MTELGYADDKDTMYCPLNLFGDNWNKAWNNAYIFTFLAEL